MEKINGWNGGQSIRLFCGPKLSKNKRFYRSILMRVPFVDAIFLLTGDIDTKPTEEKIIVDDRTDHLLRRIDVLQITHHGSKYGTGENFLNFTKPALFVTSSDQEDERHDLSPETERRINTYIDSMGEQFDTKYYPIFNTDYHGDIIVRTDGQKRTLKGVEGVLFEINLEYPIEG